MKTTMALLLLALCGSRVAADAPTFTLSQLVQRAWEHNTDVMVARSQVDGARAKLKQARAAYVLPRLRMESFGGLVPDARGDIFNPPGDTSGVRPLGPFVRAELEFAQPLYTFGQIANLRDAATAGVDVERAGLKRTQQEAAREVKELYYGTLLAQDLADLAQTLRDELEKRQHDVDPDDPDTPISTPFKLRLAMLELANREQEVADKLSLARAALAWKVGLAQDADFKLADKRLSPTDIELPSQQALWEMALAHRPDWQQLRAGIAARGAQEAAARSAYYPQLFLAGGVRYAAAPGRTDQHNPFVKDEYNLFNGAVVLGVRQSFEWGLLGAEVDQARARRRQLEARGESAGQGIRLEIQAARIDLQRALATQERALEARNLVREWVQIARDEYDLDPSQIKELVSAFEALASSEEAYYRALYDTHIAVAELERVVGVDFATEGAVR